MVQYFTFVSHIHLPHLETPFEHCCPHSACSDRWYYFENYPSSWVEQNADSSRWMHALHQDHCCLPDLVNDGPSHAYSCPRHDPTDWIDLEFDLRIGADSVQIRGRNWDGRQTSRGARWNSNRPVLQGN